MRAYKINNYISEMGDRHLITKFGGQPDWISEPLWPVSTAWDNRPLKFIGQVKLNDFYDGLKDLTLAYIFMTQPEDREDSFYDPDIIFPDEGENAVIIQPNGKIPKYIHIENLRTGPTVDSEKIWIPQTTKMEEMPATDFDEIDVDKFLGIPAFFQNSETVDDSKLLLQLHTNWLPFYINAGGAPTMFVFLYDMMDGGYILIEDM